MDAPPTARPVDVDPVFRTERLERVRTRTRRAAGAVASGLLAAASVALYHVHNLSSLSTVLHHMVRDWYEIPVFLAVACPLFYAFERRSEPGFGGRQRPTRLSGRPSRHGIHGIP
jgi:hypothetical protein